MRRGTHKPKTEAKFAQFFFFSHHLFVCHFSNDKKSSHFELFCSVAARESLEREREETHRRRRRRRRRLSSIDTAHLILQILSVLVFFEHDYSLL